MSSHQFVILARGEAEEGTLSPIGSRHEILAQLAPYNTAPEREGEDVLYGPGIRIEMPSGDQVSQMLMTVMEEEIAWQTIMRLMKSLPWKLLDPSTGRELSP